MPKQKPFRKTAAKKVGRVVKLVPARRAKSAKGLKSAKASVEARDKLKKHQRGVTEVSPDELDPEEAADELAAAVEVDPDAVAEEVQEEPIADRKEVKDLLEAGRQKGFLTYDEVNDALPADIVSSEQIDDVMSMFGDNEIEIVDAQKAAKASDTKPTVAASEEPAAKEVEEEEEKDEDDEPGGKSNDPVRLYLRKM